MATSIGGEAPPMSEEFIRESRGDQSSVTSSVFVAIAFLFVALRMYTRGVILRNVGPEDWTIVAAWIFSMALTICILFEVKHGQGHHIQTLTIDDLTGLYKALYASIIFYQSALVLNKLSFLFQYLRIFPGKNIRLAVWIMFGITGIYGFWSVLASVLVCIPVSYFWDKVTTNGRCLNTTATWFANAGINIVTDIIIFLLPMPALKQLQLPRAQKIGLMLVFAVGGFVCLTSILRLRALHDLTKSTDVTWENGPIAYWSSVEVNVGIICASLPTLKAFATRYFPSVRLSLGSGKGSAATASKRKSGTGMTLTRTKNSTVTEIEFEDHTYIDTQALDPGHIQVTTVVEQEHEEISDSLSMRSQSRAIAGRPVIRGPEIV